MINLRNKRFIPVVIAAIFALSLLPLPELCSATDTVSPADPNRVLSFLSDVIGLDVSKYDVNLNIFNAQDYSNDGIINSAAYISTTGTYSLDYFDYVNHNNSLLDCSFSFANTTLLTCTVYNDELNSRVPPFFSKPLPSNIADAAATILERYEAFLGDPQIGSMREMLTANIDPTKDSTIIVNNLKMEILTRTYTSFEWKITFNGADYPGVIVTFKDGAFYSFGDFRCLHTIGNTTVNITQEQAIAIALKQVESYSFKVGDTVYSNLIVVQDKIHANLTAKSKYSYTDLYPCWNVQLPLKGVYDHFGIVIRVELWADNGEIISCSTLGSFVLPSGSSSSPYNSTAGSSPEPTIIYEGPVATNSQNVYSQTQFPATYVALAFAVILIPTIIFVAVRKKQKNKNC